MEPRGEGRRGGIGKEEAKPTEDQRGELKRAVGIIDNDNDSDNDDEAGVMGGSWTSKTTETDHWPPKVSSMAMPIMADVRNQGSRYALLCLVCSCIKGKGKGRGMGSSSSFLLHP